MYIKYDILLSVSLTHYNAQLTKYVILYFAIVGVILLCFYGCLPTQYIVSDFLPKNLLEQTDNSISEVTQFLIEKKFHPSSRPNFVMTVTSLTFLMVYLLNLDTKIEITSIPWCTLEITCYSSYLVCIDKKKKITVIS